MSKKSVKLARKPEIEVILPVFNEVKNILPLVRQLDNAFASFASEVIVTYVFVNDGSTDGSTEMLHALHRDRKDVKVIDLIHNFGHASAITCGIENFNSDIAILMDSDLQDDPDSVETMYRAWKKGAKTVVAERLKRKEKTRLLFGAFYFLLHKVNRSLPPINFGTHCLLDRSVVQRIQKLSEKNRYFPGLVSFSSSKIHAIPMNRNARAAGSSRVGFIGLINLALSAFLSFSTVPIRLVSFLGFGTSLLGFTAASVVTYVKLFTDEAIPGWASTISSIGLTSGVQLLCLGIIGEYVGRIYDEVKDRPAYLIDNVLEPESRKKEKDHSAA